MTWIQHKNQSILVILEKAVADVAN